MDDSSLAINDWSLSLSRLCSKVMPSLPNLIPSLSDSSARAARLAKTICLRSSRNKIAASLRSSHSVLSCCIAPCDPNRIPIAVGMFIFLALGDHHCVVNDGLVRMGDKILDSRIKGSRVFQIFLDAAHIEIDTDEGWEAGLFGAVQYPETGGLAARELAETLERCGPEGFIHGGVVECP